eukprot:scaffold137684_cov133-Phaeocystis_antarctica.AAC.2
MRAVREGGAVGFPESPLWHTVMHGGNPVVDAPGVYRGPRSTGTPRGIRVEGCCLCGSTTTAAAALSLADRGGTVSSRAER